MIQGVSTFPGGQCVVTRQSEYPTAPPGDILQLHEARADLEYLRWKEPRRFLGARSILREERQRETALSEAVRIRNAMRDAVLSGGALHDAPVPTCPRCGRRADCSCD